MKTLYNLRYISRTQKQGRVLEIQSQQWLPSSLSPHEELSVCTPSPIHRFKTNHRKDFECEFFLRCSYVTTLYEPIREIEILSPQRP